ncbi:MAG: PKD domain-containing protein, partial [Patescibacteria group bacterium]
MKRTNKIQKFLVALLLSSFLLAALPFASTASAEKWCDYGPFSCGEEEISFTEFEGGLTSPGDDPNLAQGYDEGLTRASNVREFAVNVTNFILGFLGLIGIIMIIYGGFMYLTAGGEQEQLEKGKKSVLYAAVGIVIVMASYAIVNTLIQSPTGESDPGATGQEQTGGADPGSTGPGTGTGPGQILNTSSRQSLSMMDRQVKTLVQDLITAYINHTETVNELDAIRISIEDLNGISAQNVSNWNSIGFVMNEVKADVDMILGRYDTIKNTTGSILLEQQAVKTKLIVEELYAKGVRSAGAIAEKNLCKVDETECTDPNVQAILKGYNDYLDKIKNLLKGEPISIQSDISTAVETIELTELTGKNQNPNCKDTTKVGTECMKKYSAEGFYAKANEIKLSVYQLYQQFSGITSVADEKFDILMSLQVLQNVNATDEQIKGAAGLIQEVKDNVDKANFVKAQSNIQKAIETTIQLMNVLATVKFVNASVKVDVAQGSAPLIVNFDALNSYDPSNISIGAQETSGKMQVQWDLNGDGTYNSEPVSGDIECYQVTENDGGQKSSLTPYCIYKKPGVYRVGLKIKSTEAVNEATQKPYSDSIAEGKSFITIKVDPPTTKLTLKANDTYIRKYDANGQLVLDRTQLVVTKNEAEQGINFSIEESEQIGDQKTGFIKQVKWDFGDDFTEEGYSEANSPADKLSVTHVYPEGKYRVTLETTNTKNQQDRIIFDVLIQTIKADIKVTPSTRTKVGTEITVDASGSKTDVGEIINYDWSSDELKNIDDFDGKSKFSFEVEKTGNTKISLTVKNNNPEGSEETTATVEIVAESAPPVANFQYKIPDQNKPSKVHFDGGMSYDPDIAEDSELVYEWYFGGEKDKDFMFLEETSAESKRPILLYFAKGTYDVKLKVYDKNETDKYSTIELPVVVENALSVWWSESQQISAQMEKTQMAETETAEGDAKVGSQKAASATLKFSVEQLNATAVEWDFGDGETEVSEDPVPEKPVEISHTYKKSGKYRVKVTVFDEDDNDLNITRNIMVGEGDTPVAAPRIYVDGSEVFNFEQFPSGNHPEEIVVTRKSVVTLDASDSLNTDGTGRKLSYEWQFGDGKNSITKTLTHTYKDVDLMVGGEVSEDGSVYKVLFGKLIVRDKEDTTSKDEIEFVVKVVSSAPTLKSLTAVIEGESVETPLDVKVEAIDPEDEDGKIIQYRWFYFDVAEDDVILGQQITKSPKTKIKISPRGEAGEEKTYKFDVEITDNENTKVFASEILPAQLLPTATVINGPNEPPVAKFSLDRTSVEVGEVIHFNSTSKDEDGEIIEYMWDLSGDGFENDEWTDEDSIEFKFTKAAVEGIRIRLKVRDNNYTEAISKPVIIYVTSDTEPPKAAFTYQQIG